MDKGQAMGQMGWQHKASLALVWVGVVALGIHFHFTWRWGSFGTGDWLAYWSWPRTLLLGTGYGPVEALQSIQGSVGYDPLRAPLQLLVWPLWNPPPLVVPLLPFAALDFAPATLLWLGLSTTLYLDAAFRVNRVLPEPLPSFIVIPVALLICPFATTLIIWGQPTIILAAFLLYAWLAHRQGKPLAVGILLVPLCLKPHLFFIAILLLGLASLRQSQLATLAGFVGLLTGLTAVLCLLDPFWFGRWQAQGTPVLQTYAWWDRVVWLLRLPDTLALLSIPVGATLGLLRYRHVRLVSFRQLGEAMILSVLFSPQLWSHDLVVWLAPTLWLGSALWHRRQGWWLILLGLTWFAVFRLSWLRMLTGGLVADRQLYSLAHPLRFLLFVALFLGLWLWLQRSSYRLLSPEQV